MKRLLSSTTALSLALFNVQPWPLMAQTLTDDGSVIAADGTVLCAAIDGAVCNPDDYVEQAAIIAAAMAAAAAQADADAAAQAAAEADAALAAAAQADADAKAAADAVTAAEADAAAAAAAQTDANAKAAADAATAAEADAAAAAAAQTDADAKAAADAATAAEADATAAQAQAQADADAKATADAAAAPVEPAVVEAPVLTAEEQAAADAAVAAQLAADAAALAAAEAELKVQTDGTLVDPAAGLKTADAPVDETATPVDVLVPTETEVQTLSTLLAEPEAGVDPATLGAAAGLAAVAVAGAAAAETPPLDQPVSADAVSSVTELLTEQSARSSTQEFAAAPVAVAGGKKKNRLSDLEKVGLVVLGALVVGAIINEGNKKEERRVVSNTGDRIVVLKPDGTYQVYKDDDAVIRRPGSNVRTETYNDGSTRTIVARADGTQIVTIRDATGRVLRRAQYDSLGRELVLINDLEPEEVVIIRDLPKPRTKKVVISTQDEDAALKAALAARDIAKLGRTFSLRQIREIAQVRALAATIDVDTITFDSGSAAIKASEAQDLADLGRLMQDMIDKNPGEMFLVEGHTDATGKAALNLALSDRRAESVALALTEYFDIPPENMVIQGYGEAELRVDTLLNEPRNRRVAVRIITPLLRTQVAAN